MSEQECEFCLSDGPPVISSVSDKWVHPGTSIGRVICKRQESPAEQALRSLASYVGNGGYNSPTVDAKEFEAKIRHGIDAVTQVEVERRERAESETTSLRDENARLRGALEHYANTENWLCEECEHGKCCLQNHEARIWGVMNRHGYDIAREALAGGEQ